MTESSTIPKQIGRFQVACELGQGGMGTIYLSRLGGVGGFERLIALKMIHHHLSKHETFVNMFLDEARIAAGIRHPNVVPVFEVGQHEGRYFIAMDYVSGEPFSILLDQTWCLGKPPSRDVMAYVVAECCEALHAAHELRDPTGRHLEVVHRDVSPQNIMIGYDGSVRVMDFGVAKATDQLASTRPGMHKGKVPYMSPEQVRSQPVDRRSDVFALGVLLWEATMGRRLFKGKNDIVSAAKVLKGKVPHPCEVHDDYPRELAEIALRALGRRPKDRYPTARHMGQALRSYLASRQKGVSAVDVETLVKEACARRHAERRKMEREARAEAVAYDVLSEHAAELFSGESQLPIFEVEIVDDELMPELATLADPDVHEPPKTLEMPLVDFDAETERSGVQQYAALSSDSNPARPAPATNVWPAGDFLDPAEFKSVAEPTPKGRRAWAAWLGGAALILIAFAAFAWGRGEPAAPEVGSEHAAKSGVSPSLTRNSEGDVPLVPPAAATLPEIAPATPSSISEAPKSEAPKSEAPEHPAAKVVRAPSDEVSPPKRIVKRSRRLRSAKRKATQATAKTKRKRRVLVGADDL